MSESQLHKSLVRGVCEEYGEAVRTKGFRAGLRGSFEDIAGDFDEIRLQPDAFVIDEESALVIAFECEVGNRLSAYHLGQYTHLWFMLDSYSVDLWLIVVNQHGHQGQVDLLQRYHDELQRKAAGRSPEYRAEAELFFKAMGG